MRKLFTVFLLFAFCGSLTSLTQAQDNGSKYRIGYDDGLLTISAKKANLKRILTHVANEADILVKFPHNLSRQITIKLSSVPLKKALRRLLRGENYAFVYEGSDISEVYVVPKSSARSGSRNYSRPRQREDRIRASIARYEKRLETLKDRMAQVNETSRRGKAIMRQIRSTEKTIERLHKSLEG
jgi:predicted RNase H-like nuclease (RuvC/YqgF family)